MHSLPGLWIQTSKKSIFSLKVQLPKEDKCMALVADENSVCLLMASQNVLNYNLPSLELLWTVRIVDNNRDV